MSSSRQPVGVIYDIQALQNPLHRDRGIGRYLVDHVNALIASQSPLSALALNPQYDIPNALPQHWLSEQLVRWNTPQIMRDARRKFERVVYHIPSPFEPTIPEAGVSVRHALLQADVLSTMVFDTIPYLFPEVHQRTLQQQQLFRLRAQLIRRSNIVLTISEHTRRDALQQFALDPTRVVSHGTGGSEFFVATPDRRPTTVAGPYLLAVSGWGDPRKDPHTAFRAFARLRRTGAIQHKLVVACSLPPEGRAAWTHDIISLGIDERDVVFTGHINDEELRSLYTHTDAFILSSHYEGFGLPALEAARCGAPVLTTNSSSLPEVLNFVPGTFAPNDDSALAALLLRTLTDTTFRRDLLTASQRAADTHVWSKVAQRTEHAWHDCAQQTPRRTHRSPRQASDQLNIALVGPFPPSKSGIGTFNARIGEALASRCQIDFFTEGDDPFPAHLPRAYGSYPVQSLGRTLHVGAYDALIHTIGNGHYHRATLASALRTPGIVWLHDAHLAGLYLTSQGLFLPSGEATPATLERARAHMRAKVHDLYGSGPILSDHDWWLTETYDRQGLAMLRELLRNARALIVNTEAAAAIARREAPSDLDIYVVPLPYPVPKSAHTRNAALRATTNTTTSIGETITISTLGWIDPLKQPHDLISAFSEVTQTTDRPARLVFVGELADSLHATLAAHVAKLGITPQVIFTGFTDDTSYASWLERTDIAVQLRASTRGEASAALCDTIAYGIPTITSISTANELPQGVVRVINSSSTASDIAGQIIDLINNEGVRKQLSLSAHRHSESWTFDAAAQRVLEIVELHRTHHPVVDPSLSAGR